MKEFRILDAEIKANRDAVPTEVVSLELASIEPEPEPETELGQTECQSAPRTMPPSIEFPKSLHFTPKRSLDDAPNFFGHQEFSIL